MGKYSNIDSNVYSIFGLTSWIAEKIKTYPANFVAIDRPSEFIKVSIIPSGPGINLNSVSGVIIIDIYVPAGKGPQRASLIADKLDTYLSGQTLYPTNACIQLLTSSVSVNGVDKEDPSLYRTTYTIPFNYFEVM